MCGKEHKREFDLDDIVRLSIACVSSKHLQDRQKLSVKIFSIVRLSLGMSSFQPYNRHNSHI